MAIDGSFLFDVFIEILFNGKFLPIPDILHNMLSFMETVKFYEKFYLLFSILNFTS